MGFWDIAKTVGKAVIDNAVETAQLNQQKIDRAYDLGCRKSDESLVNAFKTSSGPEKIGYAKVLEERGYLEKDDEGKYRRTSKILRK